MNQPDGHPANAPGHAPTAPRRGRGFAYFVTVCVVLLLVDLVHHRHTKLAIEEVPGFYGFYGFSACVLLVLAARALRRVLMRPEDYYDAR